MWYKVIFSQVSPLSSDLSSDVVWGHMLWAGRYLFSEDWVREEINKSRIGEGIKVSSLLPYVNGEIFIPNLKVDFSIIKDSAVKKYKKIPYIPLSYIMSLRNEFSVRKFVSDIGSIISDIPENLLIKERRLRNSINRKTGTTLEQGGLYGQDGIRLQGDLLFFLHWPYTEERLDSILQYIESTGYGAHRSIGYGRLRLKGKERLTDDEVRLFEDDTANAVILLGLCSPLQDEFDWGKSWYSVKMKVGKLGEEYARHKPFYKRPIWFLEEGSVMRWTSPRSFYGRIEEDVHIDKNICHYGISFGINVRLLGEA